MRKIQPLIFLLLLVVLPISLITCKKKACKKAEPKKLYSTVDEIKKRGKLRILTLYSSTSYFIYRGQPMGYEYELASRFAESLGVQTEVIVAENVNRLTQLLLQGKGDVVAYNMPITNQMKDSVIFCGREYITHQVLIQQTHSKHKLLKDVTELIGKDIFVIRDTRYHQRLIHLNQELGGGIRIHNIGKDTVTTEDLIEMVSTGKIPYTVADNNIAKLNKTYFENIDVNLNVSFPQRSSWIVDKKNHTLAYALNQWFAKNFQTEGYKAISKRYFEQSKRATDIPLPKISRGKISPFDQFFKKYSHEINWDWRLLAAVAFVESKFKPDEESWAGAKGLMQLMPRTAASVGIYGNEVYNPESNIQGAVKSIRALNRVFSEVKDHEIRIKFVLAAYNTGIGHVLDAQALAKKYGKSPLIWDEHVAHYLALKSNPEFYDDPVCKSGYARGEETCRYVKKVLKAFQYYKSKTKK